MKDRRRGSPDTPIAVIKAVDPPTAEDTRNLTRELVERNLLEIADYLDAVDCMASIARRKLSDTLSMLREIRGVTP